LEPAKVDALLTPHVPTDPYFRWVPFRDADTGAVENEYRAWLPLNEIFPVYSSGIQTKNDSVCIGWTSSEIFERVTFLDKTPAAQAARELGIKGDGAWSIASAKQDLRSFGVAKKNVRRILYRPFDWRYTYYTNKSGGFLGRPRYEVMRHMANGENLALIFNRQIVGNSVSQFGATRDLICHGTFYLGNKGQDYLAPLYTFENELLSRGKPERRANLSPKFIAALKGALGAEPKPEEVFHYLLAVFHSEKYRERYGELIKQDFPRVPLTHKKALFAGLVSLGKKIASLHMMESGLKHSGTNPVGMVGAEVEKADYDEAAKTIWIDKRKTKGLKGVEPNVWAFFVGGYQVCEKWLKDRKGESLSKNDVEHYQLVVATLDALSKQMKEVDAVIAKHGGWPAAFTTTASAS
jgi:hypothetical protein